MPPARIERIGGMTGLGVVTVALGCRLRAQGTDAIGAGDKTLDDGFQTTVELACDQTAHQMYPPNTSTATITSTTTRPPPGA